MSAARLIAIALTAGFGTSVQAQEPVRSLLEIRREHVVVQEWDLSCGAAALATLLRYQHGVDVTEREIAITLVGRERYLQNPEIIRLQNGFSLLDLKRFADGIGLNGVGFGKLELADLNANAPIMVPIKIKGYDHFVVYRGQMGNRVLLADPAFGTTTMTVSRFERSWIEIGPLGRVGFIVGRGDSRAPPNALAPDALDFVTLG